MVVLSGQLIRIVEYKTILRACVARGISVHWSGSMWRSHCWNHAAQSLL